METALIFVLVILCGLTLCAKKHAHLDYKTIDVAYPLRHKQYFDLKYKTSGVADPSKHKKYIDLGDRSCWKTEQLMLQIQHTVSF